MYAIEIKNLNFGYSADRQILKNINLQIEPNKFVCVVGHNGSGKSTLSKLLSGLVQADSGSITICNIVMNQNNIKYILNKLGLIFQNPDNQFIGITPEDDISFGLENRKVPSEIIKSIVDEIAEIMNLKSILKTNSSSLSGGQKQKVAIASVLANNPEIIIFDESTAMLDEQDKKEIQKIMRNLVKKEGKTVISITHDMEELIIADEIIVLRRGEIVAHCKDKSILQNPTLLEECNLNVPFIYELANNLKKYGIKLGKFNNEEEIIDAISGLM